MQTDPDFPPDLMEALGPSLIKYAIIGLIIFAYFAVMLTIIARKTGTKGGWMAWVPIANLVLMCRIAGKSRGWVVLLLIPLVNLIAVVFVWADIARARGFSGVTGGLIIVPALGLLVPAYLAFGSASEDTAPTSGAASTSHRAHKRPESVSDVCPKCGRPLESDDLFCGECGHKRSLVSDPQPPKDREPEPPPTPRKSSGAGVVMALILIAGLAAGSWWIYQNGLTNGDQTVPSNPDDSPGTDPNDPMILGDDVFPEDTTLYVFEDNIEDENNGEVYEDDEYVEDEFIDDDDPTSAILELLSQADMDEELQGELDQILDTIASGPPELEFRHLDRSYSVSECMSRSRNALEIQGMSVNESGDWWLMGQGPVFTTYVVCINRGSAQTLINVTSAGPSGLGADQVGEQIATMIDDPAAQTGPKSTFDVVISGLAPEVHFWYLTHSWTVALCLQRADTALQSLGMTVYRRTNWGLSAENDLYSAYVSCLDLGNGSVSINTTIAGGVGSGSLAQRDRLVKLLE